MTDSLDEIRQYYDRRTQIGTDASANYGALGRNAFPIHLRAPHEYVEKTLAKEYRTGATLLDLCCGLGGYSVAAAQIGYIVTGVDISDASLTRARLLSDQHAVAERCQFEQSGVLEYLRGTKSRFDVIFMSGSLSYFDTTELLSTLKDRLKVNGLLIIIDTVGDNPIMDLYRRLRQKIYPIRDVQCIERLPDQGDIQTLEAGFSKDASVHYFDFFTLIGSPLRRFGTSMDRIFSFFRAMDRWLLSLGSVGCYLGFKFVFQGRKT